MMEIVAANLNGLLEKNKYNMLMSYVLDEKRERIRRFYRFEDAQRTLIGDILIRYLICKRLKIENHKLIFDTNKYGKPFLININGIQFCISHSGKLVVCCIDNLPIGIDVGQVESIDVNIPERFFSEEEVSSLMDKKINDREDFFYDLWSLKESYIKAVGKGLSIPLDSFTIRIKEYDITVCSKYESNNYYFRQYLIDKAYKMAVCARQDEFPCNIKFIDVNELYKKVLLL